MWLVILLWFALAINYVDRQMAYSIFPALKTDLGFSDSQLGLIGSTFSWVYSLSMPLAGRMADRFRRDWMIAGSMVLWSAATLGCSFSGSVGVFLGWRGVMGVTESLYYPAAVALLGSVHVGPSRSKALGIHQSAQFAGLVVGGSYGGWMADNYGWRTGFGLAAIVGIVYALVLAVQLRSVPASKPVKAATSHADVAGLVGSACYVALAAAFFCFCAMLWIFYAWFPAFLVERYHLSMTSSGINATVYLQAACGLGVVVGSTLADRLTKYTPAARFYVAAAGILLSAPFGYLTFAAGTLEMTRIYSALYGGCSGLMVANVFASAFDVMAARNYGFGSGVMNMVGGMASAAIIYLVGLWKNTVGFPGMLAGVAVACVVTASVLVFVVSRRFSVDRARALAA